MPEVVQVLDRSITFARKNCLDEFLIGFWCATFKDIDKAKGYIDALKEVLYLYRTQGNISAIAGLIGTMGPEELKQMADTLRLIDSLTISIMEQAIGLVQGGVQSLLETLNPWGQVTKFSAYLQCPGIQNLFSLVNRVTDELTDGLSFLLYRYNRVKNFLQNAGKSDIINEKYIDTAIDVLDYLSSRIAILCAPFRQGG